MIYELRIYTILPGKVPEFLEILKEGLSVREKHAKLGGLFFSEIGKLNQVLHLCSFDSLEDRSKTREALINDAQWQKVLANLNRLIVEAENKILIPADFSPLK
jgi:hypothetical protein